MEWSLDSIEQDKEFLSEGFAETDSGTKDETAHYPAPLEIYLKEIGRHPLLTKEEEQQLARLARQGNAEARQRMIKSNLRLVVKFAGHYLHSGVEQMDLIAEGNIGLMRAVGRFNPDRGFRFSTYASHWIKQAMLRAIQNQSRTVRLPVHVGEVLHRYRRNLARFENAGQPHPSKDELAKQIGVSVDKVDWLAALSGNAVSLDTPLADSPELTLGAALPDTHTGVELMRVHAAELKAYVNEFLKKCSDEQRDVIEHHFGLNGRDELTLDEIAMMKNTHRVKIRKIEQAAMHQLRVLAEEARLTKTDL